MGGGRGWIGIRPITGPDLGPGPGPVPGPELGPGPGPEPGPEPGPGPDLDPDPGLSPPQFRCFLNVAQLTSPQSSAKPIMYFSHPLNRHKSGRYLEKNARVMSKKQSRQWKNESLTSYDLENDRYQPVQVKFLTSLNSFSLKKLQFFKKFQKIAIFYIFQQNCNHFRSCLR